jgi:hypothetical protein
MIVDLESLVVCVLVPAQNSTGSPLETPMPQKHSEGLKGDIAEQCLGSSCAV